MNNEVDNATLTVEEQTHYVNFWKRSLVTLILVFNFTTHNGKLKTSTCEEYKDTLISAINATTKHSFLAKCQDNFLSAKKESLKVNELFLRNSLKIMCSL